MNVFKEIKGKIDNEFSKHFTAKAYLQYFFDSTHREFVLIPLVSIPLVLRIKNYQETFILRKPDSYLYGKPVFKVIRGYSLSIESEFLHTTKKAELEIIVNGNIENNLFEVKQALHYDNNPNLILEYKDIPKIKMKKIEKTNLDGTKQTEYIPDKSINGKIHIRTNILEKRDIEKNSSFEIDTWSQTAYNKILLRDKLIDIQVIMVIILLILLTFLGTWLIADNYFESYYRERYSKKADLIIPIIQIGVMCCRFSMI